MKKITYQFASPVQHAFALTAFIACIAFAGPSLGSDAAQASTAKQASAVTEQAPNPVMSNKGSGVDSVEAHIKHLREQLKITSAQEDQWKNVAQVMRDNAEKLNALVITRSSNAKTMTAVDNLKSYADIAEAHEDGTKKLIPVFQSLYDSMSEEQKKAADTAFRGDGHGHGHHKHPRHRS
jgi:molecular chaperone GrpE (heat shock protein)